MDERQTLIRQLDQARRAMRGVVAEVDVDLQIYPGWTIKEMLAHIAGWDDAASASIRAYLRGDVPAVPAAQDIDYYNAQTVAERATLSLDHIVREWEAAREEFKDLVRALHPERLNEVFVFPWGPKGNLARLVAIFAHHEQDHASQIQALMHLPNQADW